MIYLLAITAVALGLCLSELHQTRQDLAIVEEAHRQLKADLDRQAKARRQTIRVAQWGFPVDADFMAPPRSVVDVDGHTVEAPLPALTTGGRS